MKPYLSGTHLFYIAVSGILVTVAWGGWMLSSNPFVECVGVGAVSGISPVSSTASPYYCDRLKNGTRFYSCIAPYNCTSTYISLAQLDHLINETRPSTTKPHPTNTLGDLP